MQLTLLPEKFLQDPEVTAMLQAYYSRSAMSITKRISELADDDLVSIKAKLKQWYIGYNHDSIGDCGNAVVFFEKVSMLFAKALQDNPLYNGQETSTRFMMFSKSSLLLPVLHNGADLGTAIDIQNSWMQFYVDNIDAVIERLQEVLPHSDYPEIEHDIWLKSIKARAFDIMRAFLPAGTSTQVSFYGSLRNLRDSLSNLMQHPLVEIALTAKEALVHLAQQYPSAFANDKYSTDQKEWLSTNSLPIFYNFESFVSVLSNYPVLAKNYHDNGGILVYETEIRMADLKCKKMLTQRKPSIIENYSSVPTYVHDLIESRPQAVVEDGTKFPTKTVPTAFGRFASYSVQYMLDFGSFRDIQRHRNCKTPLPILTDKFGIHPWYLDQLQAIDSEIYKKAVDLIITNTELLASIDVSAVTTLLNLQYVHPMGMQVLVDMTVPLDEMFYISELRSSLSVHPTLRPIAIEMGLFMRESGFTAFIDESPDAFVPWRGKQDIVKRPQPV